MRLPDAAWTASGSATCSNAARTRIRQRQIVVLPHAVEGAQELQALSQHGDVKGGFCRRFRHHSAFPA